MTKRFSIRLLFLTLILTLAASTAFAEKASVEEQRAEIDRLHNQTLQRLYEKYPNAERVIKNCYAYATLSNSGVKVLLFGNARGRGEAINNETGEKVYLRMREGSVGLGVGAKEYDLIFLLRDKAAWDSFIVGKTRFGGAAGASATDGSAGDSIEGAEMAAEGVWVYQVTKKGIALEASLKGTKIYADKKLNK